MKKDLVIFKGIGGGVKIILDKSAPMYEILDELERKINEHRLFFGTGNCDVRFDGRVLSGSEKQRLDQSVSRLLPMARVIFDAPKQKDKNKSKWISEYKSRHKNDNGESDEGEPQQIKENFDEEVLSILHSTGARLYQGIIGEGAKVRSEGHLVLLGTAEKGSELLAEGDIIVIGGLYGRAHAGCGGHNGSYVLAMDMRPERITIADVSLDFSYDNSDEQIKDEIEPKHGILGKFRRKSSENEIIENNLQKTEFPAVALCKNHKIQLDNFTIKTFTNPKNMI